MNSNATSVTAASLSIFSVNKLCIIYHANKKEHRLILIHWGVLLLQHSLLTCTQGLMLTKFSRRYLSLALNCCVILLLLLALICLAYFLSISPIDLWSVLSEDEHKT